jgi:hypothetical protein
MLTSAAWANLAMQSRAWTAYWLENDLFLELLGARANTYGGTVASGVMGGASTVAQGTRNILP